MSRLNPQFADAPEDNKRPNFYEFEKLADRTVTDADLVHRLKAAVTDPANLDGPPHGRCFLPRLVVHIGDATHWTDFVICTECRRLDTYSSDDTSDSAAISPTGCEVFDDLMKQLFPQYVPHSNEHRE